MGRDRKVAAPPVIPMSTAGARHLAESAKWMAAQEATRKQTLQVHAPRTEPPAEQAPAHDEQPSAERLRYLMRRYGDIDY